MGFVYLMPCNIPIKAQICFLSGLSFFFFFMISIFIEISNRNLTARAANAVNTPQCHKDLQPMMNKKRKDWNISIFDRVLVCCVSNFVQCDVTGHLA